MGSQKQSVTGYQKQPDNATCLVTAFAMAMELDVNDLIKRIGAKHLDHLYSGSYPYRGFNVQDIIRETYKEFSITEIMDIEVDGLSMFLQSNTVQLILKAMSKFKGVLGIKQPEYSHAVFWDPSFGFIDPKDGQIKLYLPKAQNIEAFWIVEKRP